MINSYQIDEKLKPILDEMHQTGVKIDANYLNNLSQKLGLKLMKLENEIYNSVGHKFNINSPSQLAKILYEELKIKPREVGIKRKKTHHSTSAQDLAKIINLHPSVNLILEYRELNKLKSTYLDPLPKLADENGRIHTTYEVDTATGRLSSKNPNLQNIPVRTELGKEIRKAFICEKGYKFIAADYSQIELRIAAHFSEDPTMIKAFKNNHDIHKTTAEELGVDRRTAKIVNFGILYGISDYGLAQNLKISPEDAQALIDKYFLAYPNLLKYISKTISKAEKDGYVETLYGRKRTIPELHSQIERFRKFGERVAINTPFQGTAAEIIKIAMIEIFKKFQSEASVKKQEASTKNKEKILNTNFQILDSESVKMILQVHDELIFEVPEAKVKQTAELVRDIMENAVKLKVPIIVDVKAGKNWGELKEL
jgi:DNA polymerase-1